MPPYNFDHPITPTSELKIAKPRQEASAQPAQPVQPAQPLKPAKRKRDPLNPFADWPEEVIFIINRYPEIRFAMIEALDKEVKRGTFV